MHSRCSFSRDITWIAVGIFVESTRIFGSINGLLGTPFRRRRSTTDRRTGRGGFNDASRFAAVDISSCTMTSRWRIDDLLRGFVRGRLFHRIPRGPVLFDGSSILSRDLEPSTGVGAGHANRFSFFPAAKLLDYIPPAR